MPGRLSASRRRVIVNLAVLASLLVAGCGGGASSAPSWPAGAVVVEAQGRTFRPTTLLVPADATFPLVFVNHDGDAHNVAIRTGLGADAVTLFRHDPIVATTVVVTAGPIAAGSYVFACEVHPQMTGFVVAG